MNIKKITSLLIMLLLMATTSITAYAKEDLKGLIEKQSATAEEKIKIKDIRDNGSMKAKDALFTAKNKAPRVKDKDIKSPDDFTYGEPYKVVRFLVTDITDANKPLMKDFLSGKKLSDILNGAPYFYEFPILLKEKGALTPVSTAAIEYIPNVNETGKSWQLSRIGGNLWGDKSYLCSQPDKLAETITALLQAKGITTDIDSFMNVALPNSYNFIYVTTNNQEYFIPLNTAFKSKEMTVYTRAEFQNLLRPSFESFLNNEPIRTGGVAYTSNNTTKNLPSNPTGGVNSNTTKNILISMLAMAVILCALGTRHVLLVKKTR